MTTIGPALSGMLAATARLNASAQRIASVSRIGAAPAGEPVARTQASAPSGPPSSAAPKRPQGSGYFFNPEPEEPDPARDQLDQMQALSQFKANLQSLLAGDRMSQDLLKI